LSTKQGNIISKLLKNKPHSVGAEIGVWTGAFAFEMLDKLSNLKKYYCVDKWEHYDDFSAILKPGGKMATCNFDDVYCNFKKKAKKYGNKIIIYRMTSVDAVKVVPNNSLDFVFIDANHAYEYIKEDVKLWTPKVKKGGLISGHDYNNERFGVTQAVDEIFPKAKSKRNVWYVWKEKK
jgi:predicted O-methyltransferase YrrM